MKFKTDFADFNVLLLILLDLFFFCKKYVCEFVFVSKPLCLDLSFMLRTFCQLLCMMYEFEI